MSTALDTAGPDLSPWDPALSQRVQPVLSALYHDIMGPLTLFKNRVYLIRRQLVTMHEDMQLPEETRARLATIVGLLDTLDEASHRIHRGMAVPRDAIWASVLEGETFRPQDVIDGIAKAMRSGTPTPSK